MKPGARARAALVAVFAAGFAGPCLADELKTTVTAPDTLRELQLGASCYFRSHFVGVKNIPEYDVEVLSNASDNDLDRDLSGYALLYDDILANDLDLDRVFASNISVILADVHVSANYELGFHDVQDLYSGEPYMRYSRSTQNRFYALFIDGKYKYSGDHSHVRTAFLVCVVPAAWTARAAGSGPAKLVDGISLHIVVEKTGFEIRVWENFVYKLTFRYTAVFGPIMVIVESILGLRTYRTYCSLEEIRKVHLIPVICLGLNCLSSIVMAFVFALDGWGSTGFLTEETQSVFVTGMMSSTLGSVILTALHWIRLRTMIASVRRSARYQASASEVKERERQGSKDAWDDLSRLDRFLMRPKARLGLKLFAIFCISVDCVSFVYAKILRRSIADIWVPLLISVGFISFLCAVCFRLQASGFARDVAKLVNASNFKNAENLQYLQRMTYHMEGTGLFLSLSVSVSITLALSPINSHVGIWIWTWQFLFIVRTGLAHNITLLSFLNLAGRRQATAKVTPTTSKS